MKARKKAGMWRLSRRFSLCQKLGIRGLTVDIRGEKGIKSDVFLRLNDVYIQMHHDHMLIASPGGFPEGVTVDNLLVHEPKPRNPRLAAAFKRIGLVEQTGRGVDRIFEGQLR